MLFKCSFNQVFKETLTIIQGHVSVTVSLSWVDKNAEFCSVMLCQDLIQNHLWIAFVEYWVMLKSNTYRAANPQWTRHFKPYTLIKCSWCPWVQVIFGCCEFQLMNITPQIWEGSVCVLVVRSLQQNKPASEFLHASWPCAQRSVSSVRAAGAMKKGEEVNKVQKDLKAMYEGRTRGCVYIRKMCLLSSALQWERWLAWVCSGFLK